MTNRGTTTSLALPTPARHAALLVAGRQMALAMHPLRRSIVGWPLARWITQRHLVPLAAQSLLAAVHHYQVRQGVAPFSFQPIYAPSWARHPMRRASARPAAGAPPTSATSLLPADLLAELLEPAPSAPAEAEAEPARAEMAQLARDVRRNPLLDALAHRSAPRPVVSDVRSIIPSIGGVAAAPAGATPPPQPAGPRPLVARILAPELAARYVDRPEVLLPGQAQPSVQVPPPDLLPEPDAPVATGSSGSPPGEAPAPVEMPPLDRAPTFAPPREQPEGPPREVQVSPGSDPALRAPTLVPQPSEAPSAADAPLVARQFDPSIAALPALARRAYAGQLERAAQSPRLPLLARVLSAYAPPSHAGPGSPATGHAAAGFLPAVPRLARAQPTWLRSAAATELPITPESFGPATQPPRRSAASTPASPEPGLAPADPQAALPLPSERGAEEPWREGSQESRPEPSPGEPALPASDGVARWESAASSGALPQADRAGDKPVRLVARAPRVDAGQVAAQQWMQPTEPGAADVAPERGRIGPLAGRPRLATALPALSLPRSARTMAVSMQRALIDDLRPRGAEAPLRAAAVRAQLEGAGWRFRAAARDDDAPVEPLRLATTARRLMGQGGEPLPERPRGAMEQFFGVSFGDTRIHTGPDAAALTGELRADAVQMDDTIFFGAGKARFDTPEGLALLGHELAHVAQTRGARPTLRTPAGPQLAHDAPAGPVAHHDEYEALQVERELQTLLAPPRPSMPLVAAPRGATASATENANGYTGAAPAIGGSASLAPSTGSAVSVAGMAPAATDRSTGEPGADAAAQPGQPNQPDLDSLARDVYERLRFRLAIERERRGW